MQRAWEHDVCLSFCNVGGLWSHSAVKSISQHMTQQISVLVTCMPKLTEIVVSCDQNSTEVDQWGMEKCGVLHFSCNNQCIQWLACCAILAACDLLYQRYAPWYHNGNHYHSHSTTKLLPGTILSLSYLAGLNLHTQHTYCSHDII